MRVTITGLLFACVALTGCMRGESLDRHEFRARSMGTEARIVLYAHSRAVAESAAAAAFARLEAIDAALSDYRANSELSRVMAAAHEAPVPVGDDLFAVMRAALALARETGGAFDPTVGALSLVWRDARARGALPDSAAVCAARASVGWARVDLDSAARTVSFKHRGTRIDVGAIGKGYGADEAAKVLRAHGIERALIVFGGEILALGPPPNETGWRVAVEHADSAHAVRLLAHRALSTSGDAEQFLEVDGVRNSHVIDPRTGYPLTSRIAVTVVAPTSLEADGWATVVAVLDSAQRERFIGAHAAAEFYVRHAGEMGRVGDGERRACAP